MEQEATSEQLFPMMLVQMADCLQMTSSEAYEVLEAAGRLHEYTSGKVVGFVSHQWVGENYPDPTFNQFSVFQQAIQNVISGTVAIEPDFVSQMVFSLDTRFTELERDQLPSSYIWYDFYSVPQAPENRSQLISAVKSIAAYVELAKYFFVLAPSLPTAKGTIADYKTWSDRGWCRLELSSRVLAHDAVAPVIVILSPCQVSFVMSTRWVNNFPGEGQFTVSSDREPVCQITKRLLDGKIRKFGWRTDAGGKSTFITRWFMAMRSRFLSLPIQEREERRSPSMEHFLRKYHFDSASDAPAPYGMGPLFFALLEGDLAIASALVEHSADVNQMVAKDLAEIALMRLPLLNEVMAYTQSIPETKFLLDHDADINRRAPMTGYIPLNGVKNPELLHWVWSHQKFQRADLHHKAMFGMSALHCAAFSGEQGIVSALLEFQADPLSQDDLGLTPVALACCSQSVDIAKILLAHCPEVLRQRHQRAGWGIGSVMEWGSETAYWLNPERGVLVRVLANIKGGTALHHSCLLGATGVARAILDVAQQHGWLAEALAARNAMGSTPLELAQREQYQALVDLLSETRVAGRVSQRAVAMTQSVIDAEAAIWAEEESF